MSLWSFTQNNFRYIVCYFLKGTHYPQEGIGGLVRCNVIWVDADENGWVDG